MQKLRELLIEELQDILHAENQLVGALPKMAKAAHHPKLKEAFEKHLVQTRGQVERLNTAFELLGEKAEPKPCKAMMGLVKEGEETIEEGKEKDELTADLALIIAAQKVEHYEIASYGSLATLASGMGQSDIADLLEATLAEEKAADEKLTDLAEAEINETAFAAG